MSVGEIAVNRSPRGILVMAMLTAAASTIAGCTDSRMASTNATSGAQASSETTPTRKSATYQTGYGLSSDGPTTDLYTELFRSNAGDDRNAPATVASGNIQQGQPALASSAAQQEPAAPQVRPATNARNDRNAPDRNAPVTVSSGKAQQGQPALASSTVQQEPAAPQAPPPTATVYGMSSDGPTTDLYKELFGSRSSE